MLVLRILWDWFCFLLQFIAVKIVIPDRIQNEIYKIIEKKYFKNTYDADNKSLLSIALNDAYTKKCETIKFMWFNIDVHWNDNIESF